MAAESKDYDPVNDVREISEIALSEAPLLGAESKSYDSVEQIKPIYTKH